MDKENQAYERYAIAENDPALAILRASEVGCALLALNDGKPQKIYRMDLLDLAHIDPYSALASWSNAASYNLVTDRVILFDGGLRSSSAVDDAHSIAHELAHRFQIRSQTDARINNVHEYAALGIVREIHANAVAGVVLMQALEVFEASSTYPDYAASIKEYLDKRSLSQVFENHCYENSPSLTNLAQKSFEQMFETRFNDMDAYVKKSLYISNSERERQGMLQTIHFTFGSFAAAFSAAAATVHDEKTLGVTLGVALSGAAALVFGALGLRANQRSKSHNTKDQTIRLAHIMDVSATNKIPMPNEQGYEIFDMDDAQYNTWEEGILDKVVTHPNYL